MSAPISPPPSLPPSLQDQPPSALQFYVRHLHFPLMFLLGAPLLWWLRHAFEPASGAYQAGTLALAVVVPFISTLTVACEWLAPATGVIRERPLPRILADVGFASASVVVTIGGHALLALLPRDGVLGNLSQTLALPTRPLWMQVAVAFLVSELILYAWHRAQHESGIDFLWRLHAFHHRAPRMMSVTGGRASLADLLMNVVSTGVIVLVGVDPDALVICLFQSMLLGSLHHSDLDIRLGWFNWVMPGPQQHHIHHSIDPKRALNYATNLAVLDQLFGTASPLTQPGREVLGIVGEPERF